MKKIALFSLALVIVGCNSSQTGTYKPKAEDPIPVAQLTPGQEADLFPVAVGNTWRYKSQKVQANGGQRTGNQDDFQWIIRKVDDLPNGAGKRIIMETVKKDVATERQTWLLRKDGLFIEASGIDESFPYTPPEPLINFPIETGKDQVHEGQVPSPFLDAQNKRLYGKAKLTTSVSGPEEVDTDMGRISAYKVTQKGTIDAGAGKLVKVDVTMFWAPKVGLVRMTQVIAADKMPVGSSIQMLLSSKTLMQ